MDQRRFRLLCGAICNYSRFDRNWLVQCGRALACIEVGYWSFCSFFACVSILFDQVLSFLFLIEVFPNVGTVDMHLRGLAQHVCSAKIFQYRFEQSLYLWSLCPSVLHMHFSTEFTLCMTKAWHKCTPKTISNRRIVLAFAGTNVRRALLNRRICIWCLRALLPFSL